MFRSSSSTRGDSGLLSREIDLRPYFHSLRDWIRANPTTALVSLGISLRAWEYLQNRSYWMDEGSLLGNLSGPAVFDFSGTLAGDQLAPFGFMVIGRCIHRILGGTPFAMRLFPLACGIAALVLFSRLAGRILAPRAAVIAVVLFSLSSDLIYYSAELKQYSTDLAVSLLLTLTARDLLGQPMGLASGARLLALALASPWMSFSSSFVVAGAGATLLIERLIRGRYRDATAFATIGASWAISFGLCYRATHALLNKYTTMYVFWDFAFLPFPPRDMEGFLKLQGILLDVFVNPLNMVAPVAPAIGVIVPIAMLAIGVWSLGRRAPSTLSLIALPVVLAILASGMRKYPFHGRLILELVPPFFLLFAEGTEWIRLKTSARPWVYPMALILLLAYPLLDGLLEGLSRPPRNFDIHGDLRHNLFLHEHLERVIPSGSSRKSGDSTGGKATDSLRTSGS